MYRFKVVGYAFGAKAPLDLAYVGYTYAGDGSIRSSHSCIQTSQAHIQSAVQTSQYFSQDDHVVLKFGPISRYCAGFSVKYQAHYQNQTQGLEPYAVRASQTDSFSL
jgi:hypothetical protein